MKFGQLDNKTHTIPTAHVQLNSLLNYTIHYTCAELSHASTHTYLTSLHTNKHSTSRFLQKFNFFRADFEDGLAARHVFDRVLVELVHAGAIGWISSKRVVGWLPSKGRGSWLQGAKWGGYLVDVRPSWLQATGEASRLISTKSPSLDDQVSWLVSV